MLTTYPATLLNGRIEWGIAGPPPVPAGESVEVQVTILPPKPAVQPANRSSGESFEELARRGTAFAEIEDVVEWQREIRKDRPLFGREE